MTPLGNDVDPDVYCRKARSSEARATRRKIIGSIAGIGRDLVHGRCMLGI